MIEIIANGNVKDLKKKLKEVKSSALKGQGFKAIVSLLNSVDEVSGKTLLHIAVENRRRTMLEFLLKYPVDLSSIGSVGKTAEELAFDLGYLEGGFLLRAQRKLESSVGAHIGYRLTRIRRILEKTLKSAEQVVDKDIVLFFGRPGVGKSTLVNYLVGATYRLARKGIRKYASLSSGKELSRVGHEFSSQTSIPQIGYSLNNNYAYCDLAGLGAQEDKEDEFCSILGPKLLANKSDSIKAVCLVVSLADLEVGNGEVLINLASRLYSLVNGDMQLIQKSAYLIITKVNESLNSDDILNEFIQPHFISKSQHIKDAIQVLKAIKNNVIIPDIFDQGNSRLEFEKILFKTQNQNSEKFYFDLAFKKTDIFSSMLEPLAKEFVKYTNELHNKTTKDRKNINCKLSAMQEMTSDWTNELNDFVRSKTLPDSLDAILNQIEGKRQKITLLKIERERLLGGVSRRTKLLDEKKKAVRYKLWDEVFRPDSILGCLPGYHTKQFSYKGQPFTNYRLRSRQGGFNNLQVSEKKGELSVQYTSCFSCRPFAKVCIYTTRNLLPEYQQDADNLAKELEEYKTKASDISSEISALQVRLEVLEKYSKEKARENKERIIELKISEIHKLDRSKRLRTYIDIIEEQQGKLLSELNGIDNREKTLRSLIKADKVLLKDLSDLLQTIGPISNPVKDFMLDFSTHALELETKLQQEGSENSIFSP